MNSSVFSRFSATLGASTTGTTYARLALVRFYAAKKGKGLMIKHTCFHVFRSNDDVHEGILFNCTNYEKAVMLNFW